MGPCFPCWLRAPDGVELGSVHGALVAPVLEILVVGDVFEHFFLLHEEVVFAIDFLAFGGARRVGDRVSELVRVVRD